MAPSVAAYFSVPKSFTRLAPGTAAGLLARAGRRSRGHVRTAAKWGAIAGPAVTCNAMRRQRLGHRDQSGAEPPGRRAASPPSAGVAHQLRHCSADAPSRRRSTLTRGGLGGGGPAVRYTSPFALAVGQNLRRDALCPSAAPAPSPGRTTVASSHPA